MELSSAAKKILLARFVARALRDRAPSRSTPVTWCWSPATPRTLWIQAVLSWAICWSKSAIDLKLGKEKAKFADRSLDERPCSHAGGDRQRISESPRFRPG